MNFEKDGNKDSWSSVTNVMPIPQENGIGHSQESWIPTGIVNPIVAPRRPIPMNNTPMERVMLQRNGIVQNANNWTPVTPEKLITERSNPIRVDMQENRLETENWQDLLGMYTGLLQEKTLDINGILDDINPPPPPLPSPLPPMVYNNGNQNWVAQNHASNSLSYFNTSGHVERNSTASTYLTSMLGSQQPQRFNSNNLIGNGHIPKNGFPVTSPSRLKPDSPVASSIINSFPVVPITPEKVNFSVEETSTSAKDMHGNQTVSIQDAENLYNELLQTIGDSPASEISTTQKEHVVLSDNRDKHNIDLNKTPQQKTPTRRRKHRPKVIREGKPKKTPTPKDQTRVKRKYVKKTGVNEKTPVESVGKRKYVRKKSVDYSESQQKNRVDETPPKSCKKRLNFDLEHVAEVENHDNSEEVNKNIVFQANMVPKNMQATSKMLGLDENRGIKRQISERMGQNVTAMDSLLLYQKFLLGVAHRAHDRNSLRSVLLENHKKIKMQSEFQALEENSRRTNGVYGNVSAMQLLNSCTGRVNPSSNTLNGNGNGIGNVGNRQFRPPIVARHYLQKHLVSSGMQPRTMRLVPERSPQYSQGAVVSWKPSPPTLPGVVRYAVTAYPPTSLNRQNEKTNMFNQRLNGLNQMLQQRGNNLVKGYQQNSKMPRGRPRKQKAEVTVDDITHKLEDLHIYDEIKKQQNKLILYRGSEAIIPFEPIKKRNRRPKVDLDPETERIWRLLMGIEGCEGAETVDKDKEKWWEDERRVFRGRAESFIARMHLVQGDRRFSRWKGSVVDSVIGVFLTQNVSDHLSSSAFMSLAARFPLKSTTTNETCCQDRPHEDPIELTEPNDIIKCQEKITSSESSTKDAENKRSVISDYEVIQSQDSFDSSTIQTVDKLRSSSGSNSEADELATNVCHLPNEPDCNMQNVGSLSFEVISGVTGGYDTSNVTYPQNKTPNGAQKQESATFGGIVGDRISVTEANSEKQNVSYEPPSVQGPNMSKAKKGTVDDERKREIDWDSLRKEALSNGEKKERSKDASDSLDYEALRHAHVNEISDAIRERGMNNLLADRMKDFLNRLVRDHGKVDLEWLRDAPPDKAK